MTQGPKTHVLPLHHRAMSKSTYPHIARQIPADLLALLNILTSANTVAPLPDNNTPGIRCLQQLRYAPIAGYFEYASLEAAGTALATACRLPKERGMDYIIEIRLRVNTPEREQSIDLGRRDCDPRIDQQYRPLRLPAARSAHAEHPLAPTRCYCATSTSPVVAAQLRPSSMSPARPAQFPSWLSATSMAAASAPAQPRRWGSLIRRTASG